MADQTLTISNFSGGLSDDDKLGQTFSFSAGQAIDFRRSPSLLKLHRKATKESSTTIVTEVHDAVRVDTGGGIIYMAGETEIYKRTPGANGAAGTYSVDSSDASLIGVRDLDYRPDLDSLFIYDEQVIHELHPISNSPSYDYNKYQHYNSFSQLNTGSSYLLPAAISESEKFEFTCTKEPLHSVTLQVDTRGASGNWVLTVHDGANNVIGTATVLFANVPTAGNTITFTFATPLRLKIGATYHIHVHATAGTHRAEASSTTLPTAYVILTASRLVNTDSYGHATIQLGAKTFICNERYIAEWEILDTSDNATSGYDAHRLVLPAECIAFVTAKWNEYAVFGCAIKDSSDTTNDAPTRGKLIFWDGSSVFYEFDLDLPGGAPWGLYAQENVLHWESNGKRYRWAGGDIELVFEYPGVDEFEATSGAPNSELYLRSARRSMTVANNLLQHGFPHTTANQNIKIGVYSYGRSKGFMPLAFGYDTIISTGSTDVNFNTATTPDTPITGITLVKNFGNNLLIAWKDYVGGQVVYGVDYVNDVSAAAAAGSYESLWFDNGRPDKEKTPKVLKITCTELPEDCTITPKYRIDRSEVWEYGTGSQIAGEGDTVARMEIHYDRFREIMVGFDVTSSSGNQIGVISVNFKFDDNEEEEHDT